MLLRGIIEKFLSVKGTMEIEIVISRYLRNKMQTFSFIQIIKTMFTRQYLLPLLVLFAMGTSNELSTCKLHVYLARAEQMDDNSLRCWDTVKVPACGGRCDSREISDWEFPFKKSHHPVCVHGTRRPLTARLRHCDDGVAEGTDMFHFVAADDCRCKVCSSQYTSCEWLPPNSTLLNKINTETDEFDDYKII